MTLVSSLSDSGIPSEVLKIASHPGWYPESAECALDGFDRREKCKMPGYGPEILGLILKYIGISYEIIKLPADAFGGEMNDSNGTVWNGVLGDLQNGKYDTISAPYIITEDRCTSFDFSVPINSLETIFVVGPDEPDFLLSTFRLFLIFDPALTIAAITVILALIFGVVISQISYRKRNRHRDPILKTLDDDLLHEQFETSGKIFALFLGFSLLLFIGLYEGCLLTYLLLPPQKKPMSESQLLDRVYAKKLTFVTDRDQYDGYGNWQLVRFSKLEKYRIFQATIKQNPPLFTSVDPASLSALFKEHPTDYVIYGDSSALMFAKSQIEIRIMEECPLYPSCSSYTIKIVHHDEKYGDEMDRDETPAMKCPKAYRCSLQVVSMTDPDILRSGFVFRKNSSLINIFNEAINRNWNFVQAVRDHYLSVDRSNCSLPNESTQVMPLTLITLLGSFSLMTIGFSLAIFVLLLEKLLCTQSFLTSAHGRIANKLKIRRRKEERWKERVRRALMASTAGTEI